MAASKITAAELAECDWQELRTELAEWDDGEAEASGFDGLTRFWCKAAVFEVYWTAERTDAAEFEVYLTEDLELAGFQSELAFKPDLEIKQNLAAQLNWQATAQAAIRKARGPQLRLVEE